MQTRITATAVFAVLLFLSCAATGHATSATQGYWQDVPARPLPPGVSAPDQYRLLDLDVTGLKRAVAQGETRLALPVPDGGFIEVTLEDSGVMPPELAARYPQIRSFRGQHSDGTRVRVDISPLGVNAMVFAKAGIWLVRPVQFGDGGDYISFKRTDVASQREPFDCDVHNFDAAHAYSPDEIATTTGTTKRSYRAAVAANRFYVQALAGANPPTVAIGLAGVVAAMNRVNEVYENDLSIHMSLVPNNDLIIYPDAASDPYSNGTGALNQNTGNLNTVIGAANYDIGHVFTTGSGGVAGLGVVCTSSKGRGTTGLSNPAELVSDIFYIDYVAHEMGHQFGANHTFNNSCGGNRSASSAYETGSGSTIMAYAGICSPNLQSSSDAYFHARSLLEIGNFTTTGSGSTCSANTANHAAPVLDPLSPYTIPASTPFALTGSATSGFGSPLTFAWEQYDLGSATVDINVDPGNGPIIRSFMPTESPVRTVPRFSNLLAGTSNVGEILPTTNRNLSFRLTVRDNAPGGGTSESSDMVLTVNNSAGPFAVTNPPAAVTWDHAGGSGTATVTWNVANTNAAPVNCANVDIDIHTGGDYASSTAVLATGVPNSGSATVNIPNVASTTARVRVRCSDNIFFALNPGNFTILGEDLIFADGFETGFVPFDPPTLAKAFAPASVATGTPSTLTITLANPNATVATLTAALTDTFPTDLVVATTPNAATTCMSGSVSTTSGSVTLAAGAQIPASGNCTVTVDVESATVGSYANTIAAGALQTDVGDNASAANATLTVTGATPLPAFFNSALTTASPTFDNPQGATGLQYYCAQQFTVDANGSYTIETTSPNTSGTPSNALDTFLRLYANAFDPGTPATGIVASNDDFSGTLTVLPGPYTGTITATTTGFSGAQPGSRIVQTLATGTTYIVVNTSYRATTYVGTGTNGQAVGPYYTGINGPGNVNLVGSTCTSAPELAWPVTPITR